MATVESIRSDELKRCSGRNEGGPAIGHQKDDMHDTLGMATAGIIGWLGESRATSHTEAAYRGSSAVGDFRE